MSYIFVENKTTREVSDSLPQMESQVPKSKSGDGSVPLKNQMVEAHSKKIGGRCFPLKSKSSRFLNVL